LLRMINVGGKPSSSRGARGRSCTSPVWVRVRGGGHFESGAGRFPTPRAPGRDNCSPTCVWGRQGWAGPKRSNPHLYCDVRRCQEDAHRPHGRRDPTHCEAGIVDRGEGASPFDRGRHQGAAEDWGAKFRCSGADTIHIPSRAGAPHIFGHDFENFGHWPTGADRTRDSPFRKKRNRSGRRSRSVVGV